jgi:hypothetical protein
MFDSFSKALINKNCLRIDNELILLNAKIMGCMMCSYQDKYSSIQGELVCKIKSITKKFKYC